MADLVAEFGVRASGMHDYSERLEGSPSGDLVIIEPAAGASTSGQDAPLLSIDQHIRQASRGRGAVVYVTASNDNVFVATSRGYLLRYTWDEYGNERVAEVEVVPAKQQADVRVTAVFADPWANHVLLALKGSGGPELAYVHRRWNRARPLAKLKGAVLTAVAWCYSLGGQDEPPPPPPSATHRGSSLASSDVAGQAGDSCTGPIVLGTELGCLLEVVLDERQKKEGAAKTLLDLKAKDRSFAFTSLHQFDVPGGRRALLGTTPGHLYCWITPPGSASLEAMFVRPGTVQLQPQLLLQPVLEAVAPSYHSQLQLYWPHDISELPSRFAWLVGGVLYHGDLDWPAAAAATARDGGAAAACAIISGVGSLPLAGAGLEVVEDDGALGARSLVVSEYHFLLLAGDRLSAVNRVSGRTVQALAFRSPLTRNVSGEPSKEIDGLVKDPVSGTVYMAVDEVLYEVALRHESRGMWRVYLDLQDWDSALRCCSSQAQRDEVHRTHAEAAQAAGDYNTAAVNYAKVQDGRPPFEEVALMLSECGVPGALQLFLSTRLAALSPRSDRAQCTLVAAWLTELHLDTINRALLEAGGENSESYQAAGAALRAFLGEWAQVLDPGTTVSLLASYGRLDDLLHYAQLRADYEGVLEQLLARHTPQGARRALTVLRNPSASRELVYKFAPALVAAAPEEAVDFFVAERPPLEPRRLVPALLRYGEPNSPLLARRHVLRYVEFAIEHLGCQDSVLHNLAVALYSLAPGSGEEAEAPLLRYLARAGRGGAFGNTPLYDLQYALRLTRERNKPRAAVRLMCQLGMYSDAVRLALGLDLSLAKGVAAEPEDDTLRRKLWLQVARHVVESGSSVAAAAAAAEGTAGGAAGGEQPQDPTSHIKTAVDFLREADGLLKIEDILPFFPDFVTIDNFQAAICDSLERYGKAIEGLKADMEEATTIAEALRQDIKLLESRTATISTTHPCVRCRRPISEPAPSTSLPQGGCLPEFYLFATGCTYHTACCAAEVTDLVAPQQRKRIHTLMVRLARAKPGSTTAPAYGGAPPAEITTLQAQLAAEIATEDPRNGELTVRLLEQPFVFESDKAEAETWAI